MSASLEENLPMMTSSNWEGRGEGGGGVRIIGGEPADNDVQQLGGGGGGRGGDGVRILGGGLWLVPGVFLCVWAEMVLDPRPQACPGI